MSRVFRVIQGNLHPMFVGRDETARELLTFVVWANIAAMAARAE
jgi:hypothetical protein